MTSSSGLSLSPRTVLLTLLVALTGSTSGFTNAHAFVGDINKSPVTADGDVRDRRTDFVIDLDLSLDPAEPGIALDEYEEIRVTLPEKFVFDPAALEEFPVCSIGMPCPSSLKPDACVPGEFACTTALFLQGYPQSPIFPDVRRENHTLVLSPRGAIGPVIKQIHIFGKAIINPRPGRYLIGVEHVDRYGKLLAGGKGILRIRPNVRPSINVTSVFASLGEAGPPFANTVYQATRSGATPYPWNFLIWNRQGEPFTGIELLPVVEDFYLLRRDGRTVGSVSIEAPFHASGYSLALTLTDTLSKTPVIGIGPAGAPPPPVERYQLQFDVGQSAVPGRYTTTLRLNSGNAVQMIVDVPH